MEGGYVLKVRDDTVISCLITFPTKKSIVRIINSLTFPQLKAAQQYR